MFIPVYVLIMTINASLAGFQSITQLHTSTHLDKVEESAVERRAERLDVLVEFDSRDGTLGNTFWRELEFLQQQSAKDGSASELEEHTL